MNEDINLIGIKQQKNTFLPEKKVQIMRAVAMLLLFVVSAVSIILFILVALSPLPELRRQESTLRNTLSLSYADIGKMHLIEERVTSAGEILNARRDVDVIIAYIVEHARGDISVTSLRMDKDELVLHVSSKSLASLDAFLTNMIRSGRHFFTQVTLNDLSTAKGSDVYTMIVQFTLE